MTIKNTFQMNSEKFNNLKKIGFTTDEIIALKEACGDIYKKEKIKLFFKKNKKTLDKS
jgi:Fe-S oxidoreductase